MQDWRTEMHRLYVCAVCLHDEWSWIFSIRNHGWLAFALSELALDANSQELLECHYQTLKRGRHFSFCCWSNGIQPVRSSFSKSVLQKNGHDVIWAIRTTQKIAANIFCRKREIWPEAVTACVVESHRIPRWPDVTNRKKDDNRFDFGRLEYVLVSVRALHVHVETQTVHGQKNACKYNSINPN